MPANDNYLSEWRDLSTLPSDYEDAFLAWDGIGICIAFITDRGYVGCTAPDGVTMRADEAGFTLWRPMPPSPPEELAENELLAGIEALGPNKDDGWVRVPPGKAVMFVDISTGSGNTPQ